VFSIRRDVVILFAIFLAGVVMRMYFGFYRPTGDLDFYTALDQSQITLIEIEKTYKFYPLLIFDTIEMRIFTLSVILTFMNAARLMFAGSFNLKDRSVKMSGLLITLSIYWLAYNA
jgi:hypothetical protein